MEWMDCHTHTHTSYQPSNCEKGRLTYSAQKQTAGVVFISYRQWQPRTSCLVRRCPQTWEKWYGKWEWEIPLLNSYLRFSITACSDLNGGKLPFGVGWWPNFRASFMSLSWNNSKPPSMPFKMEGMQLVADGAVASPKCKCATNSSK